MADAERLRHLMETEGAAVNRNVTGFNRGRYEAVAELPDYDELKARARAIKEDAIERLPELIESVEEAVAANGGTVYRAANADEARSYVDSVATAADGDTVVKSKSMTTEEIDLNERLEASGLEVIETDLGEWVLQLADETPSHIVTPAIHRSREDIAQLVRERFDPDDPPTTAPELTRFARERLRSAIDEAQVGITGANFIAADSGSIVLVTSEGNARRVVDGTRTHVAVAGVEKLIPSISDLDPFLELIARSATGQDVTSYYSILTPPVESPVVDWTDDETPLSEQSIDREFHLVLLDNGRMDLRVDDDLRETLYCIRCSACANSCANFQHVGGHAFGGETYSGGIATGWEAAVEGLDVAAEFNDLCTGCSRCVNACPVGIDIPWINTVVRSRRNADGGDAFDWLIDELAPDPESPSTPWERRVLAHVDRGAQIGSKTAPLSNWFARRGPVRWVLERTAGIDRRRRLPAFQRQTFVEWAEQTDLRQPGADHHVVLYPDVFTNHVHVDRGIAAAEALSALGVDVVIPALPESGRVPLSQGMVRTARDRAERLAAAVSDHLENGRRLVVIEPSDYSMVVREYNRLLGEDQATALRESTQEICEYVLERIDADGIPADFTTGGGSPVTYHSHCQLRTVGAHGDTIDALERLDYDVMTTDAECCGMAGSFGYKSTYYELSMAVGASLAAEVRANAPANTPVVASGTSCIEQLDSLLDRQPLHPIQLIAPGRSTRP